ncbi:MAG: molybdopterin-dependent oxidoreductase [Slackia sp.]
MKKRTLALVGTISSVFALSACLWACAPQQDSSQERTEQQQTEATVDEAERIETLQGAEKNEAANAYYAPAITENEDGTRVQMIPNDPYMWNTAILGGDKRGCEAEGCHGSILDATQLLPATHPKLWNPYNVDATTKFCYMCHSKALFLQDSMHAIHMNSDEFEGNCDSCHYINPKTGEYQLWDLVKYDTAYMGVTPVPNVEGDFSFTQDSITPTDQLFYYWENADHKGITPDNDTSQEAYDSWEIKVTGAVDNEFTFKLTDFEDQMVERIMKLDCQTNPPGGAYIMNAEVKGIPLSVIMEKAGVDPASYNALHSIADDGWDVYPLPQEYVETLKDDILLVTEINGEKLGMLQGYPVQLWTPTLGGAHYTKRPVELKFSQDEKAPVYYKGFTNPKTGEMFNKPNTAVFNYANGTIFPAGEPIEFEGFADAYEVPVTAVEISLDKGATWTRYDLGETDVMRWVNWKFVYTPEKPGSYLLKVRAIGADGSVSTDPSQLFFNVE